MAPRVAVAPLDPEELRTIIGEDRQAAFLAVGAQAQQALAGRVMLHINSTAAGGGVAEMLPTLLGYAAGLGVDVRWHVLTGNPAFFEVTKRLHNRIHGYPGDDGELGDAERAVYEAVAADAAPDLLAVLRPGDIAVLHDPQTLGLAPLLRRIGVITIWRCHIGIETTDAVTESAWDFLTPYLDDVVAFVFSRAAYRPPRISADRVHIIAPSLDPLSTKNRPLAADVATSILTFTGLLQGVADSPPVYAKRDGSPARLEHRADMIQLGPPPPPDEPLVVQVSRWDRLKDMVGVMNGFAEYVAPTGTSHLILAGPNVSGVADDPEGAAELQTCIKAWRELPHYQRERIHLACLPVIDVEENALIVNALQRHAAVVTQKSLAEGFGLTVLEAMWKGRPVVASAVGGIRDQIIDDRYGLLLADPYDLATFGELLRRFLDDPGAAESIGSAAAQRAAGFLPDHHLTAWATMLAEVAETNR